MSEVALHAITWLLVPMGILPAITAAVLARHINSPSTALKERARLAQILGLVGLTVAAIAANRVFSLELNLAWVWVAFGLLLLLIDAASGIWLYLYLTRRFG